MNAKTRSAYRMNPLFKNLKKYIWQSNQPNRWQSGLRILHSVWHLSSKSQIKLFATALTYHTLLAIVPVLAILFTLLKSFGIEKFLHGIVHDLLAPMGKSGQEIGNYLFQFINNAQAGFLGGIGVIFLFYSIYKLFNRIESSLNHIWFIDKRRQLKDQVMGYLGIIMISVIVSALAIGLNLFFHQKALSSSWMASPLSAAGVTWAVKILSTLITAVILALIYIGVINTDVDFHAALMGGIFCALLWIPLTHGFAKMIATSSSYSLIYSSFASLIVLLIWLNILWLLFLSGGLVAYFVQYPSLLKTYSTIDLNPTESHYYSQRMIAIIIDNFNADRGATALSELIEKTQLSHRKVLDLLKPFLTEGLLIALAENRAYLPRVNPEQLTAEKIQQTVYGEIRHQQPSLEYA